MTKPTRPATTREGYAVWALSYDEHANPMTAMVAHALAQPGRDLAGSEVVELGCGTGRNAAAMLALGAARYRGVDESPEMLARATARGLDPTRVAFERGDLFDTAAAAPVDLVVISLVVEHFEDPTPVLAAAARAARHGGRLWLLEAHPAARAIGARAHVEADDDTLMLPSHEHTAASLASALIDTGWDPEAAIEWFPTAAAIASCAKLARYAGRPALLELRATRR